TGMTRGGAGAGGGTTGRGAATGGVATGGVATAGRAGGRLGSAFAVGPPDAWVSSNPAPIPVTRTPSPSAASMTAPKMMLASGAAALDTSWAASLISNRPRSDPPEMDSSTPWAPSMLASSSGLEIAISAAATERSSPRADPMPMRAEPAPDITDL